MKIGEALQELKELKSKLARLQSLQVELFSFIEGTQPDKTFEEYDAEINSIHDQIIDLRLKIQSANLKHKITVTFDDGSSLECSIAQAILEVARFRSLLSFLQVMVPQKASYSYGKEQIVTYYLPLDDTAREERISALESRKRRFDLAIQGGNWTFEL